MNWPTRRVSELCEIEAVDNCGITHADRIVAISSTPAVEFVPIDVSFISDDIVTSDRLIAVNPESSFQSVDIVYAVWDEHALFLQDEARRGEARCHIELAMSPTCLDIVCSNGHCIEEQGVPTCHCQAGWAGDECAACDEGFERRNEDCVRAE